MIKPFKLFEAQTYDVKKICARYNIRGWSINPETGLVDVKNYYVKLDNFSLTRLPIKFGEVEYDFVCPENNLTTLEGSPHTVGGYFECDQNNLTSLEGGPRSVRGFFSCKNNQLTSLEYMPKKIGNNMYCASNNIRNFYGIPEDLNLRGTIFCSSNPIFEILFLFQMKIEAINIINEWKVIYKDKYIIYDRLVEVYEHLGIEVPEDLKFKEFKEYQII